VGHTLGELHIRTRTGVSVVAVLAEGKTIPNPGLSHRFVDGELVAILGTQEQRGAFVAWAITGILATTTTPSDEEIFSGQE
jgi:K+/H+ antiporter YhaU regulatory subunit KhtT